MLVEMNLLEDIYFVNIGNYGTDEIFFHWNSNRYHKSNFFQIRLTKNTPEEDIFYCLPKSDIKIVYYAKNETIFSIGAKPEIQSELLEAILEYLVYEFFETYDDSLLKSCYGDSCSIFDGFKIVVMDTLNNFKELDLIKTARVSCKGCKKTFKIIIKKSLVENSKKSAVPLVFVHSGHALLIYIDQHFKIRGSELVDISYGK